VLALGRGSAAEYQAVGESEALEVSSNYHRCGDSAVCCLACFHLVVLLQEVQVALAGTFH